MDLMKLRIGGGVDFHAFAPEEGKFFITLGGVKVPFKKKLIAHSDGDVIIHSLCDAIFGTICDGNIGTHFPPSEAKWKDSPSEIFLNLAAQKLLSKKGKIINIDITVICEAPKVMSIAPDIRNNLSLILNLSKDVISVKAVTTEKMGFLGREEGIGCITNLLICLE